MAVEVEPVASVGAGRVAAEGAEVGGVVPAAADGPGALGGAEEPVAPGTVVDGAVVVGAVAEG